MRHAIVLFSTPRQIQWLPISLLIRWLQYPKSLRPLKIFGLYPASHVCVKLGNLVYESVFFLGVREIPFEEWTKLNRLEFVKIIAINDKEYEDGQFFLKSSLGIPYAFLELFGILLNRVLKLFFKRELYGNPCTTIVEKNKCSELVYCYLIRVGVIDKTKSQDLVEVIDIAKMVQGV